MLREVAGLSSGWIGVALVVYGLGTIAGNVAAGRVRPPSIARVLPVPLAVLAAVLLLQGALMHHRLTAVIKPVLHGCERIRGGPLVQTWLMGQAGPAAAGSDRIATPAWRRGTQGGAYRRWPPRPGPFATRAR